MAGEKFPALEKKCLRTITMAWGGMHYYVPWWKYDRKNDFPRGLSH